MNAGKILYSLLLLFSFSLTGGVWNQTALANQKDTNQSNPATKYQNRKSYHFAVWNVRTRFQKHDQTNTKTIHVLAQSNFPEDIRLLLRVRRRGRSIPSLSQTVRVKEKGTIVTRFSSSEKVLPAVYVLDIGYEPIRQNAEIRDQFPIQESRYFSVPFASPLFTSEQIQQQRTKQLDYLADQLHFIRNTTKDMQSFLIKQFNSYLSSDILSHIAPKFRKEFKNRIKEARSRYQSIELRKRKWASPVYPEVFRSVKHLLRQLVDRYYQLVRRVGNLSFPEQLSHDEYLNYLEKSIRHTLKSTKNTERSLRQQIQQERETDHRDTLFQHVYRIEEILRTASVEFQSRKQDHSQFNRLFDRKGPGWKAFLREESRRFLDSDSTSDIHPRQLVTRYKQVLKSLQKLLSLLEEESQSDTSKQNIRTRFFRLFQQVQELQRVFGYESEH